MTNPPKPVFDPRQNPAGTPQGPDALVAADVSPRPYNPALPPGGPEALTVPSQQLETRNPEPGTGAGPTAPAVAPSYGDHFSEPRIIQSVRMRFNPIRGLTPERLEGYLTQFRSGWLRNLAVTWEAMERRDYQIQTVRPKRLKGVARHGFEICTVANLGEKQKSGKQKAEMGKQPESPLQQLAEKQKVFLEHFWNNITVTEAINPDVRGGFSLLVRQMMDAVGKGYAVHEITWEPRPEVGSSQLAVGSGGKDGRGLTSAATGPMLTATFRFMPLYWFEATRGRLRFLLQEFDLFGLDMSPAEWLITTGEGLMEATAVCYMYKHFALKSWVAFLDKFGFPGILGKTDSPVNSPQWQAMEEAVRNFAQDYAAVCNRSDELSLVEAAQKDASGGSFAGLVEKIDRAITALWRGGDLGTMGQTQGEAKGVPLQESETELMEADDAQMIEETLALKVVRQAIAWRFGPDAPVLVYIKLGKRGKDTTDMDIKVDTFLQQAGAPLGLDATLERYGRPLPAPDEELLEAPAPVAADVSPRQSDSEEESEESDPAKDSEVSNAAVQGRRLQTSARALLAEALAQDFAAIRARADTLLGIEDEEKFRAAAAKLLHDLEGIEADLLVHPHAADVLVKAHVAALANGIEQAARGRKLHALSRESEMANGDVAGHPFRGNQYREANEQIAGVLSGNKEEAAYAPVSESTAAAIKSATGRDVTGFKHFVDKDALVHINNTHGVGKERQPGHEPVTREDIERIPQIVAEPDTVADGGLSARGRPTIVYSKRFNGTTYYVEEEWRGEKLLAAKTMYKKTRARE